jgi:hypothetical protein
MLVYIVVFVLIVYVVLDRSGVLADLADTFREGGGAGLSGHPELDEPRTTDPETNRRLEIFEDFIEGLDEDEKDAEPDEHD